MSTTFRDSGPSMVTAFVGVFSGLFAFVGRLQRHPGLDHIETTGHVAESSTDSR